MLASFRSRVKDIHLSGAEIAFLLIVLLIGAPMILLIPPGAGYDEEDHLIRVWELSRLSFVPGQLSADEMQYPIVFRDFAYRQQGSQGILDEEFWQTYANASLNERGVVRRELDTKSVYSPALLLPQAASIVLFGRLADLPALPVFYLARFANLLSYLTLTWLAIRWLPFGKWLALVLAASPTALFQAATLTPDAISNGIGFLFVAGALQVARSYEIGWREVRLLILFIFLLFLAKLNVLPLLLLPFLLMPPSRFASRKLYALLLASTVILLLVEVAGWNWIASRNFDSLLLEEANPRAQLVHILSYPLTFVVVLVKDLATNGWLYLQGWINGYGYYYWTPPFLISVFFLLALGSVIVRQVSSEEIRRDYRSAFLASFAVSYGATIASLYLSYTPVGAEYVSGVQGRYLIPLMLPLLLAVSGLLPGRTLPFSSPAWSLGLLTAALLLNGTGLYFSFHVECGSTFYQTGLCYRPLFKDFPNEVHNSQPVTGELSLTQEFQVACNGLSEVRVLLTPFATEDLGITRFVLYDRASEQTLLDQSIANGPVRAETWYPLRFEPDWLSEGKRYGLHITGVSPAAEQGLQFFYTPQPEFDLGDFYENGELLDEDLVLQYGCATGLRRIWLLGKP